MEGRGREEKGDGSRGRKRGRRKEGGERRKGRERERGKEGRDREMEGIAAEEIIIRGR